MFILVPLILVTDRGCHRFGRVQRNDRIEEICALSGPYCWLVRFLSPRPNTEMLTGINPEERGAHQAIRAL